MMKKIVSALHGAFCLFGAVWLLVSCQSGRYVLSTLPPDTSAADSVRLVNTEITSAKSASGHRGIRRVRTYTFAHPDVPAAFGGFRIAFVSDLHYASLLKEEGLSGMVKLLSGLRPDVLLVGGDLHEGCAFVRPVISALAAVEVPMGTYAVMGNNDYEACCSDIVSGLAANGIRLLEHRVDTLRRGGEEILIAGVRNPFNLKENGVSPTLGLSPDDFVILLTHTPDYAEDVSIANTDLVLAGHTHGGQVTLFGLYAPILPSHYGQRFRSGLKRNSRGIPMIITNGIGTSNRHIRLFAPSEVVLIELRRP